MPTPRTDAGAEAVRSFGRRLAHLFDRELLTRGDPVTQQDLAMGISKALGLEPPLRAASVSRWVLGQSMPDLVVLGAIARYFDVDPGWLAFGDASAAPKPPRIVVAAPR